MNFGTATVREILKYTIHEWRQRLRSLDPRPAASIVNVLDCDTNWLAPRIEQITDSAGALAYVIDLGRHYPIMKLSLRRDGRITVSNDGQNWTAVRLTSGHSRYFSPRDLRARYVKVVDCGQARPQELVNIYVRRFDLLLAQICRQHGIDYDKASGYGIPKNKWEILRIIASRRASIQDARTSGVLVRKGGRLGNNLLQLINAIYFCETLGISKVHLFEQSLLQLERPTKIKDIEFLPNSHRIPHKNIVLDGRFFYLHGLKHVYAEFSESDAFRISKEYLRELLAPSLFTPTDERGPNDLVIHIRAGDIFAPKGKPAPANYVQPPFAFYLEAVAHHGSSHPAGKVHVVYEDRGNPCVDALERHLVSSDIDHVMLSGSLERDFNILVNAHNLVLGFGTFGQLAVYLSDRTSSLYTFRQPLIGEKTQTLLGIRNYTITDVENAYLQQGTWANTPEQREFMLTFPRSRLKFVS